MWSCLGVLWLSIVMSGWIRCIGAWHCVLWRYSVYCGNNVLVNVVVKYKLICRKMTCFLWNSSFIMCNCVTLELYLYVTSFNIVFIICNIRIVQCVLRLCLFYHIYAKYNWDMFILCFNDVLYDICDIMTCFCDVVTFEFQYVSTILI